MHCVDARTELLCSLTKRTNRIKSDYSVDMWREVRRRWLVVGVLFAVLLAVLGPRLGATGGPLHMEYMSYLPLTYIYYKAGGRARGCRFAAGDGGGVVHSLRVPLVSAIHAHLVAPALCAAVVGGYRNGGVDQRVLKGAVLSSVGAPCGWLAMALCRQCSVTAATAALGYTLALIVTPLSLVYICGRATIPHLGGVISTVCTTLTPFVLGAVGRKHGQPDNNNSGSVNKLSALLLLYVDCCGRFSEAEGSLYVIVGGVFITLLLVVSWLAVSSCACCAYAWSGILGPNAAGLHTLLLCSVPKGLQYGLQSSLACTPTGLSALPGVFLSPAQALLVAVITPDDDDGNGDSDGMSPIDYQTLPQ